MDRHRTRAESRELPSILELVEEDRKIVGYMAANEMDSGSVNHSTGETRWNRESNSSRDNEGLSDESYAARVRAEQERIAAAFLAVQGGQVVDTAAEQLSNESPNRALFDSPQRNTGRVIAQCRTPSTPSTPRSDSITVQSPMQHTNRWIGINSSPFNRKLTEQRVATSTNVGITGTGSAEEDERPPAKKQRRR